MNESVIALIFDFDGTLGPDTISALVSSNREDPKIFWKHVDQLVENGWDPPLAYMHLLWKKSEEDKLDLSKEHLYKIGKKLTLFPGLPKAFLELKEFVTNSSELKEFRVSVEFYIISGGMEEIIRATSIAPFMHGIFGCNFSYDERSKQITGIKQAISFTEKTRYLYGINKGVGTNEIRNNPYKINDSLAQDVRRVPFSHMIYIGDGPSDIPCLSAITQNGGMGIGVSSPDNTFKKGYELARGRRITVGPYTANYKNGSDMRKVLEESILRIGLDIAVDKQKHIINAPRVG